VSAAESPQDPELINEYTNLNTPYPDSNTPLPLEKTESVHGADFPTATFDADAPKNPVINQKNEQREEISSPYTYFEPDLTHTESTSLDTWDVPSFVALGEYEFGPEETSTEENSAITSPPLEAKLQEVKIVKSSRRSLITNSMLALTMIVGALNSFTLLDTVPYVQTAATLAFLPLLIVLTLVRRVERPRPQRNNAMLIALAAGASVGFALALNISAATYVYIPSAWNAGLVEETVKLVVLLLIANRWVRINSPVDGAVVAMLIGAGLAYTENIAYYAIAANQGDLISVFLQRGLLSPLAHSIFSACFGFALGMRASRSVRALAVLSGLVSAITLHALWNTLAETNNAILLYFPPFHIATVILLGYLARRDMHQTVSFLRVNAGPAEVISERVALLTAQELDLLGNLRKRIRFRRKLRRDQRIIFDRWCELWLGLSLNSDAQDIENAALAAHPLRSIWQK
jgi:RsiW-degrading membrane proteinase PrsW (M82 family)